MLGHIQCWGTLLIVVTAGQGPSALAASAEWVCFFMCVCVCLLFCCCFFFFYHCGRSEIVLRQPRRLLVTSDSHRQQLVIIVTDRYHITSMARWPLINLVTDRYQWQPNLVADQRNPTHALNHKPLNHKWMEYIRSCGIEHFRTRNVFKVCLGKWSYPFQTSVKPL